MDDVWASGNSPLANARFGAIALGQHGVCGSLPLTQIPPSAELRIAANVI